MDRTGSLPTFIYLAGADGTGKTTHARAIADELARRGAHVRYLWFRWPHVLSLPLLAYCRLRGLTRYHVVDGVRYGGWQFYRSRMVSGLFPWLWLVDTALASLATVYFPRWLGRIVVCDRFAYDALVDLMLAVNNERLLDSVVGRAFLRLVPKDGVTVLLDAPDGTLRQRKADLKHDNRVARRREMYLALASHLGLPVVDTAGSAEVSLERISALVARPGARSLPEATKEQGIYPVATHPLLRPLLRRRAGALFVSWVFQGLLYMDRTERWFKLAIDGIVTAAVGIPIGLLSPLGLGPALVVGFLLAHTANWVFNGQIFVVLKAFGGVRHSMDQWERYMRGLNDRIRREPSIRWAGAFGSLVRGQFSETSDLDVRIIRQSGFVNAIRACWFVLKERTRAFFSGYPLDIYVLDSERLLEKLRGDEAPVILHGTKTR